MYKVALVLTVILLTACGGEGGGSSKSNKSESILNIWESDTTDTILDFRSVSLDSTNWFSFSANSITCSCELNLIGYEDSGAWSLSSCYADHYSDNEFCRLLEDNGRYNVSNSKLTLTSSNGTETYHLFQ